MALVGSLFLSNRAAADVTLVEKDDWTVFTNGRVQGFFNYSKGDGFPEPYSDGAGNPVTLWGGGIDRSNALVDATPVEGSYGSVEELRFRSGFVGNVLGLGVKKRLSDDLSVQAYIALASTIQPPARRKYTKVYPDAREGFATIGGSWGTVKLGRMLTLLGRGNTEITYLYGYAYALGFPGSVSEKGEPFPTAGHVGFGVLGNGFGAGITYDTPVMGGLQATFGLFDANTYPNNGWERSRWPRPEAEVSFEQSLGGESKFKLFVNAAMQTLYRDQSDEETSVAGAGFGGRLELGIFRLGVAGHYGKGIGFNYAFEPSDAMSDQIPRGARLRTVDGYYAQGQVVLSESLDLQAGVGMSRIHMLDTDRQELIDDDGDPTTPLVVGPGVPGFTPIKQQLGISLGAVYHVAENLHLAVDYFNASFLWYDSTPVNPAGAPEQNFHFLNAGATVDW